MQISNDRKNEYAKILIVLCLIYVLFEIIGNINLFRLFNNMNFDTVNVVNQIRAVITAVITAISSFLIIFTFIRFRENNKTRKLYKTLLWYYITIIILDLFYWAIFAIFYFFFDSSLERITPGPNMYSAISMISSIYYYIVLIFPIPIYILILKKEKLDYNWMIIGRLTSYFLQLISFTVIKVRHYLDYQVHKTTVMFFNEKYPILAIYANNRLLWTLRGYFWIIGIIIMVIIYKRNARKSEEMTEG